MTNLLRLFGLVPLTSSNAAVALILTGVFFVLKKLLRQREGQNKKRK